MLILLGGKGRPKFHINKVSLGYFIVMFSFVLVTVEIFECSGPRSTPFNVARLPKSLSTPGVKLYLDSYIRLHAWCLMILTTLLLT
jgi:hypothetical protein